MPDQTNELTVIEKAGRVLSAVNAQAILDAFNAAAGGLNKLMEVIQRAGIEQAAEEEAPADEEAVPEEDAPPPDEEAPPEDDTSDEEPAKKMVMRPTQAEVNYVTLSTKKGQACANCRWFSAAQYDMPGAYCHLIDNWPEDILATGYCDRYEGKPSMEEIQPEPVPVVIVEAEAKALQEYKSLMQRFKDTLRKSTPIIDAGSSFVVYKGFDGKPKWFARYTNNFEDLEGDVFAEKAHDKTIARVEAKLVPMPYLTFWHLQGTEHGRATNIMRDGHFLMAVGDFDETPFAEKCLKYYQKNRGKIKLSLGASVPKWARARAPEIRGKLYTDYNAIHITTLPPILAKAANPFTTFSEDMVMALKPEQKEFLVKEFGQDEANRIERDNETLNKTIEQLVQYKDFSDLITKSDEKVQPAVSDKTAASLFVDMVEKQALVVKLAEGVAKRQQTIDAELETINKQHADELKALQTALDDVQKYLKLAPRASQDARTILSDTEAEQVKKQIPTEYDPFWGNLGIPKEVK